MTPDKDQFGPMSAFQDWEAVAQLTGCRKLHGAQGPAPTITEMIEAFNREVERILAEKGHPELVGSGLTSLIATLANWAESQPAPEPSLN